MAGYGGYNKVPLELGMGPGGKGGKSGKGGKGGKGKGGKGGKAGQALQMGMMGQGMMAAPTDHWRALQACRGMHIKEHVSFLEAAAALLGQEVEMANKYSAMDKYTGQPLFYVVEQTDFCTRQIKQCCNDCAPWSADILYTGAGYPQRALRMERPWTCTCCCFNRPTVHIMDAMNGQPLGSITDPCNCCGMDLTTYDPYGNTLFSANGGCCQCGTWCPLPCGPCSKVEYELQDGSGRAIGALTKHVPGCLKFFLSPDVDDYEIDFGPSKVWENPQNKALMLGLAIFMDFRYFDNNSNDGGTGKIGQSGMDMMGDVFRD